MFENHWLPWLNHKVLELDLSFLICFEFCNVQFLNLLAQTLSKWPRNCVPTNRCSARNICQSWKCHWESCRRNYKRQWKINSIILNHWERIFCHSRMLRSIRMATGASTDILMAKFQFYHWIESFPAVSPAAMIEQHVYGMLKLDRNDLYCKDIKTLFLPWNIIIQPGKSNHLFVTGTRLV